MKRISRIAAVRVFGQVAALLTVTALAGCGGGGLAAALGIPTQNCSPTSFTMNFPAVAGYGASATINSSTGCFSTAQVTTNAGIIPVGFAGFTNAAPRSTTLLYLQYSFSTNEFTSGLPSVTITAPASVIVPGRTFFLAYNNSGFAFNWQSAVEGPVNANGTTISFPGGQLGNIELSSGTPFELALYAVGP